MNTQRTILLSLVMMMAATPAKGHTLASVGRNKGRAQACRRQGDDGLFAVGYL